MARVDPRDDYYAFDHRRTRSSNKSTKKSSKNKYVPPSDILTEEDFLDDQYAGAPSTKTFNSSKGTFETVTIPEPAQESVNASIAPDTGGSSIINEDYFQNYVRDSMEVMGDSNVLASVKEEDVVQEDYFQNYVKDSVSGLHSTNNGLPSMNVAPDESDIIAGQNEIDETTIIQQNADDDYSANFDANRVRKATNLEFYDKDGDGWLSQSEFDLYLRDSEKDDGRGIVPGDTVGDLDTKTFMPNLTSSDNMGNDMSGIGEGMHGGLDLTKDGEEEKDLGRGAYGGKPSGKDKPSYFSEDFWKENPTLRQTEGMDEETWGNYSKVIEENLFFGGGTQPTSSTPETQKARLSRGFWDDIHNAKREWIDSDKPLSEFSIRADEKTKISTAVYALVGDLVRQDSWATPEAFVDMMWASMKGKISENDFRDIMQNANTLHNTRGQHRQLQQGITPNVGDQSKLRTLKSGFQGVENVMGTWVAPDYADALSIYNPDNKEIDEFGQTMPKAESVEDEGGEFGEDGDYESNVLLDSGNSMVVDDNAAENSAGVSGRGSVNDSIQTSSALVSSIQNAMGGDLTTDTGRAALLTAITTPIVIPHGYSWDTETQQLSYTDMSLMDEDGEDKGGWKKLPAGAEGEVKPMEDAQIATLTNALRLRDMASQAYTEATGQDLSRKGDIAMMEQAALNRKGQASIEIVKENVQNFMGTMQSALRSIKAGDWGSADTMLMQELPALPPGLIWDAQKGSFAQAPGFQGRQLTPEVQQWRQVVAPAYKFYDRVTRLSDAGRRMDMERQNAIATKQAEADQFREFMATDQIDNAEESLVRSQAADRKEKQVRLTMDMLKMGMEAAGNPMMLYNMKKHGFLGEIEAGLASAGINLDLSSGVDLPPDASTIPSAEEWGSWELEKQQFFESEYLSMGYGDRETLRTAIMGATPTGQINRLQYGVL